MEEQIEIGSRVVQVGEDGKPERVVEVCGVLHRESGTAYEVRVPGAKRVSRDVPAGELRRIGGPLGQP